MSEEPNPVGRPTLYKPEYADQTRKLCLLGATDKELADFFEVSETTINNWKLAHPEFVESIKSGKTLADCGVAEKLYDRATGAEWIEQQAIKVKRTEYTDGKKVSEYEEVVIVDVQKAAAPDTTAGIFWLKNRKSDAWRDKHHHEHTGNNGGPMSVVNADLSKLNPEQLNALLSLSGEFASQPTDSAGEPGDNPA